MQVQVEPIRCDLLSPIRQRVRGKVDILLSNPPYVPTSSEEYVARRNFLLLVFVLQLLMPIRLVSSQAHGDVAGAWAGGTAGMDVTDRVIEDLSVRSSSA